MVIVRLQGGLGNQMFQYALGRSLALRNGSRLRLDSSLIDQDPHRHFALDAFGIEADEVGPLAQRLLKAADLPYCGRLSRIALEIALMQPIHFVRDRESGFDASILALQGNVVLAGYWQSEKYFLAHSATIREDFSFRKPAASSVCVLLDRIRAVDAIAVHVRRGDYVSNPQYHRVHGTCAPEYYTAAAGFFHERLDDPCFFVFSDDPDWAERHVLPGHNRTIVRENLGRADHDDLRLMAACKHFIIANSSFGWWAAWLGEHPGKAVVAPQQWFSNHHAETRDLLPVTWMRI